MMRRVSTRWVVGSHLTGLPGFASRVAGLTCARRGADPPTLVEVSGIAH